MADDFTVETTDETGLPTMQPPEPPAESPEELSSDPELGITPSSADASGDSAEEAPPEASPEAPPQGRNADGTFKTRAKKGSAQYRIDQKSWEAGEARRQAADERRQREALALELQQLRQQQQQQQQQPPKPATADGRPSLDQFSTYEEYVEAVADWKADQKIAAERATYMRQRQADEVLSQRQTYHQRQEEFAAKTPDYWEVVHNSRHLPLSPVMETAILASEHGPAIIYYLSTHPQVADQLNRDSAESPVAAAPLMRRLLESQLGATAPQVPAQSAAPSRASVPAPIKPVGAGAPVAAPSSDDDLDLDAHVREMNRREKKPPPRTYAY